MLKNAVKFFSVLMMFAQVTPSLASPQFTDKQFLACEAKLLKHEKLAVELDKEQKEENPNQEKLAYLEKNLKYLDRITDKYCSGFTAQAY